MVFVFVFNFLFLYFSNENFNFSQVGAILFIKKNYDMVISRGLAVALSLLPLIQQSSQGCEQTAIEVSCKNCVDL